VFPFLAAGAPDAVSRWVLRVPRYQYRAPDITRYELLHDFVNTHGARLGLPKFLIVPDTFAANLGPGPISSLAMHDVCGAPLDDYIDEYYGDKLSLLTLASRFKDRILAFQSIGFAHGDLSHENVMVRTTDRELALVFVDFDDCYLSGMQPTLGGGHPNFQHPR